MTISKIRVTCQKCEHVFDAEVVTDCPVSVGVASMQAIRCPECGSDKVGLGGNYNDAPPLTAPLLDRARWWKQRGERGTSSNTIFNAFGADELPLGRHDIPHDPADFRRCKRLLDLIPEWRSQLHRVVVQFPYWKPFVDRWDEMEALYNEERPKGEAPKLYALMQELAKQAEDIRRSSQIQQKKGR